MTIRKANLELALALAIGAQTESEKHRHQLLLDRGDIRAGDTFRKSALIAGWEEVLVASCKGERIEVAP